MVSIPLSGTNVRLLKGVRFSKDYKHTRYFDSETQQRNWFQAKPTTIEISESNFQTFNEYESVILVGKSIDELWNTNYISFNNVQHGNKKFYAFITKKEYSSKETTKVYFQLDVLQTWMFDFRFYPSFVAREHCQLYYASGDPVVNTVPENLDYGKEYNIVKTETRKVNKGIKWIIVVTKSKIDTTSVDINKSYATINGIAQPFTYYMLPYDTGNLDRQVYVTINGDSVFLPASDSFLSFLYSTKDAVNNIVSIYVTDDNGISMGYNVDSAGKTSVAFSDQDDYSLSLVSVPIDGGNYQVIRVDKILKYNRPTLTFTGKYNDFIKPKESKLLMHPYSFTQFVDNQGNTLDIKNEYLNNTNYDFTVLPSLGYSNAIGYGLLKYNNNDANNLQSALQYILFSNVPNDIPIINSRIDAYMQGNKNSIQTQKDMTIFNGAIGATKGLVSSVGAIQKGNVSGAISSGLDTVSTVGNSVLQMQAINAKQQDISNIPPDIQKQGSNSAYFNGNNLGGITMIKKQITQEYMDNLSSYFSAYGYAVKRVKQPNLHTRQHFNYIQTIESNIQGDISNDDLVKIRSIFDNGITLWHTDDICNYNLENEVI